MGALRPDAPAAVLDVARVQETQAVWSSWSFAASVVAACCATVIVRRITSWQQLRVQPGANE